MLGLYLVPDETCAAVFARVIVLALFSAALKRLGGFQLVCLFRLLLDHSFDDEALDFLVEELGPRHAVVDSLFTIVVQLVGVNLRVVLEDELEDLEIAFPRAQVKQGVAARRKELQVRTVLDKHFSALRRVTLARAARHQRSDAEHFVVDGIAQLKLVVDANGPRIYAFGRLIQQHLQLIDQVVLHAGRYWILVDKRAIVFHG